MKGFIDVRFVIGKEIQTGEQKVTTFCIIPNLDTPYHTKKDLSSIYVKMRHEISFGKLQVLAARHKKLDRLEDKGGFTLPNCPAEYIYGEREDGSHYYLVLADIGTKEKPMLRSFYLSKDNEDYLEDFKLQYEFTKSETPIVEENDED